ncbi:MAG TPA: dihydropteroate synthase [Gemmatimonadaceae bacterium]|nr:dihydropteroate synthase [Gemmatimonadaceae bacterium]
MPSWRVRGRTLPLDRPRLLGVVNVTPDSFSDGGLFLDAEAAIARGERLLEEGAEIVDIGGESTRPQGAVPVTAAEERRRVVPVVEALRRRHPDAFLSVDTVKAEVADAVLEAGADIINDVSGFRLDPLIGQICARHGAGVILMHSRGNVSDMASYAHADYGSDPVGEVVVEIGERLAAAREAGVATDSIVLDPGIGFSKRSEHSLALLAELPRVAALGRPVLVGVSRKRFIGEVSHVTDPAKRVDGTTGANVVALTRGARLFRVHDVRPARHALDTAWAIISHGVAARTC